MVKKQIAVGVCVNCPYSRQLTRMATEEGKPMSMSNPPEESAWWPEQRQPPNYGYPDPVVRPPAPGYPARPDYPPPGYGYDTDFEAPYGRDPETGAPLSDKSA